MARLYISNINAFNDLNGVELVTNARKERIHQYKQHKDKVRCLLVGLLLRKVCDITDDSQLIYGQNGKPYLKNNTIHFSISHSGDYVILATADNEVGVDIEKVNTYPEDNHFKEVATRFFTPQEYEWILQEKRNEAFYYIWTAKESIMKGTGLGFSLSPRNFCVLPIDSSAHNIVDRHWFFNWIQFDNHIICQAIENKQEKIEILTVGRDELIVG